MNSEQALKQYDLLNIRVTTISLFSLACAKFVYFSFSPTALDVFSRGLLNLNLYLLTNKATMTKPRYGGSLSWKKVILKLDAWQQIKHVFLSIITYASNLLTVQKTQPEAVMLLRFRSRNLGQGLYCWENWTTNQFCVLLQRMMAAGRWHGDISIRKLHQLPK